MTGTAAHVDELVATLERCRADLEDTSERWGRHLAATLPMGRRLLAAGNGGSAAHAQHLTAELVGRYDRDRPAYSAIALSAETSSLTAIVNDYGPDAAFARQVWAHGRPGDALVLLSTSGRSPNVLRAAEEGARAGLTVWALTGPSEGNRLVSLVDDALCVPSRRTATVQEVHQVVLHMICASFDAAVGSGGGGPDLRTRRVSA